MPQQIINLGAAGSGAGGDDARTAFEKVIANFAELYLQKAGLESPTFTGDPKAPTPAAADNDTSIATTAFVRAAMALFGLTDPATRQAWHAGNLAKQANSTDTTPGALLAVGAANLLSATTSEGFDVLKGSRFLRAGTEGPMGVTICGGLSIGVTAAIEQQLAMRLGRAFFRSKGDADQDWRELFHSRNILGTVSQSGGVPTGAIIERGSNANGEYVRFADGRQICTRRISLGTYTSAKNGAALGDYAMPATFAEILQTSAEIHVSSTSAAYSTALYATTGDDSSGTWQRVATRALAVNADSSVGVILTLRAEGRWFN
ncbi:hypothetical protein [Stutzerimonas degradans]|uniref:hypothetical protein n=1 Tax=Stutzerimonas degradans TaxID=2968968 RepID=UPI001C499DE1|nr:hypothetical protein [Stutzerimonas degradans]